MEVLTKPPKKKQQFYLVQNVLTAFFRNTHFELNSEYEGSCYVILVNYSDGASLSRVKNAIKTFNCSANPDINFQGTIETPSKITIEQIREEFWENDNCMSDFLATVPADGLTLEEAFELYIGARRWADKDRFFVDKDEDEMEELEY